MSERNGTAPNSRLKNLIMVATNAKASWDTINLEEVTEVIQGLTTECESNQDYYMMPWFQEVLDGVVTIVNRLEENHGKKDELGDHHRAIFVLLYSFMKTESVRVALRDQYKLFTHLGVFFNPGLVANDILLILHILEASSRNMIIYWKPPQLSELVQNIYTYLLQHSEPSNQQTLAFQLLINLCSENPSCASIGRLHESFRGVVRLFKDTKSGDLGVHLLLLYQAMLPVEALKIGYDFIDAATTKACEQYRTRGIPPASDISIFIQLRDTMETISKKIGPLFTLTSAQGEEDPQSHRVTISDSKETFLRMIAETLSNIHALVRDSNETPNPNVTVDLLNFVLALLPHFVPLSLSLDSIKEALSITDILYQTAEKGSPVYHGCLLVYLHIVEQLVSKKVGSKASFDKLVSEKFFGKVFAKLSLSADVHPNSVELNITSLRLIHSLSDSIFGEEGSKKLDLALLRALVVALAEPAGILPNIQWRRSICLVELLATMSKYSTKTNMLNQLLKFVSSPNVSRQIVNCMFNGDERTVRNGIAVTAATAFAEDAASSIAKSIVQGKHAVVPVEPSTPDNKLSTCNGAMNLDSAMNQFASSYNNSPANLPNIDDLLSWYNLKLALHKHELSLANQNVTQLQKTVDHLKALMDKQFDLVSRQTVENDAQKLEQLLLLKASASQQKSYLTDLSVLKAESVTLSSQLEEQKLKVADMHKMVLTLTKEKDQLLIELKKEEQVRGEATKKFKAVREENKTMKSENARLEKELKESKGHVAALQVSLKEKEEEAERNKLLFENERQKLDTIRGVVGSNFGKFNLE